MARAPRKTIRARKKPAPEAEIAAIVEAAAAANAPENPGDARLLSNFGVIHDAIQNNTLSCVVGVAVLEDGRMIDMFGTAGNQLFECAMLVQNQNLCDDMRGLQQRRMAQQRQAQQQAALDAASSLKSKAATPKKA